MPGASRQVAASPSPTYLWISPPASAMASRSTMKRLARFKPSSPRRSAIAVEEHVDEQERPLLDAQLIAPRREAEGPRTEQIVDAEREVADDHQTKREEEVDAADYLN